MSRLYAMLKQLIDKFLNMFDRTARVSGEVEFRIAHKIEAGDELIDNLGELADLIAALGAILVDLIVDLAFGIGCHEEDMPSSDLIIAVSRRKTE